MRTLSGGSSALLLYAARLNSLLNGVRLILCAGRLLLTRKLFRFGSFGFGSTLSGFGFLGFLGGTLGSFRFLGFLGGALGSFCLLHFLSGTLGGFCLLHFLGGALGGFGFLGFLGGTLGGIRLLCFYCLLGSRAARSLYLFDLKRQTLLLRLLGVRLGSVGNFTADFSFVNPGSTVGEVVCFFARLGSLFEFLCQLLNIRRGLLGRIRRSGFLL